MNNQFRRLSVILFVSDMLIILFGLYLSAIMRSSISLGRGGALPQEHANFPLLLYMLATLSWGSALIAVNAYNPERVLRWYNEAVRVVIGATVGTFILAGILFLSFRDFSRLQFVYFYIISVMLMLGYRAALRIYYRLLGRKRPGGRYRVIIIGAGKTGQKVADMLLRHSRWGYHLEGYLDDVEGRVGESYEDIKVLGTTAQLRPIIEEKEIEEVWVALPVQAYEYLKELVGELQTMAVRIKVIPDYLPLALIRTSPEVLDGIPIIGLREPVIQGMPRIIKRGFDLALALFLLILGLVFMALIGLLIRLDSPGAALFRQTRVGENGRLFEMWKFRTMSIDAEQRQEEVIVESADGDIIHKSPDDPRVTRIGKVLRKYSLDELPQLFNVISGDMSLVGPRPEMPWLVNRYDSWQRSRFSVPQGMTGWWQINGRSDKPMHLNTDDDLYYVYNYSIVLDIQILIRTPFVVLRGTGAF